MSDENSSEFQGLSTEANLSTDGEFSGQISNAKDESDEAAAAKFRADHAGEQPVQLSIF